LDKHEKRSKTLKGSLLLVPGHVIAKRSCSIGTEYSKISVKSYVPPGLAAHPPSGLAACEVVIKGAMNILFFSSSFNYIKEIVH
jgi:hypothetical protein